MRYLRNLGRAAIAVLASSAFAGVASASAATELCSTNTNPCTGTKYGLGTHLAMNLKTGTKVTFTNSVDTITCSNSQMTGEVTQAPNATGTPTGQITSVTFENCADQNNSACTITTEHLPWHFEVHTEGTKANGNGKMTVKSGGGGSPAMSWVCGGFLNCTYSSEAETFALLGGTAATLRASEIALNESGFLCFSGMKIDAEYTISSPSPLFVI